MKGNKKVCAIAGVRSKNLYGISDNEKTCILKDQLKNVMIYLIKEHEVRKFVCGLAPGIELLSAELIIDIRNQNPGLQLQLECVEAYEYQGRYYHTQQREWLRYQAVVDECDKRTVLFERYLTDCESIHRKYLVDESDYIIAVWNRLPGDHIGIVPYARLKERPIIRINPETMSITIPENWGSYGK